MTVDQFKEKIRMIVKKVYVPKEEDAPVIDFEEFKTFPELRAVIVDLLTDKLDCSSRGKKILSSKLK